MPSTQTQTLQDVRDELAIVQGRILRDLNAQSHYLSIQALCLVKLRARLQLEWEGGPDELRDAAREDSDAYAEMAAGTPNSEQALSNYWNRWHTLLATIHRLELEASR